MQTAFIYYGIRCLTVAGGIWVQLKHDTSTSPMAHAALYAMGLRDTE